MLNGLFGRSRPRQEAEDPGPASMFPLHEAEHLREAIVWADWASDLIDKPQALADLEVLRTAAAHMLRIIGSRAPRGFPNAIRVDTMHALARYGQDDEGVCQQAVCRAIRLIAQAHIRRPAAELQARLANAMPATVAELQSLVHDLRAQLEQANHRSLALKEMLDAVQGHA